MSLPPASLDIEVAAAGAAAAPELSAGTDALLPMRSITRRGNDRPETLSLAAADAPSCTFTYSTINRPGEVGQRNETWPMRRPSVRTQSSAALSPFKYEAVAAVAACPADAVDATTAREEEPDAGSCSTGDIRM